MEPRVSSPIAQVDPRFERWRKIRVPLFTGLALVALVVSGLLIRSCVVARSIRNDLARAAELSSLDTIEGHEEALAVLEALGREHPDSEPIRTRLAWQHALMALRLGPVDDHVAAARAALQPGGEGAQTALAAATHAGLLLLEGDAEAAETTARGTAEQAPACRECAFVHGLALVELGRAADAVAVLDGARQGQPPFLPALGALAEALRDLGRLPEARTALAVLVEAAPAHRGAKVQSVLVELDKVGDSEAAAKAIAPLKGHLAAVDLDDSHPRRSAYEHYAAGRIALIEGRVDEAATELAAAARVLRRDQALATWRAKALRRAGRHADAVEALATFPDGPETSLALLAVRAEVLLDIHRVDDAAAAIAILSAKNAAGAALLEGRRLHAAGESEQAIGPLRVALAQGQEDAFVQLIEAHVLLGRVDVVRDLVREDAGSPAIEGCTKGYYSWIRGTTAQARTRLAEAAKAGARCGSSLPGRLLLGTGRDEDIEPGLLAALLKREDLRDRVALGRVRLRTKGGAEARAELDRVRGLEPQGALVLAELVDAYLDLGLSDVAGQVALEGVERTKGHPFLVAAAARIAREAGRLEDAERLVADGLKARPRSAPLLVEKAAIQTERRAYTEAEETVNAALVPGPSFGEASCLRCVIQERRGNRQDAQVSLTRATARAATKSGALEAGETRVCLIRHFVRRGRPSFGKARGNIFLLRNAGPVTAEVPYLAGLIAERDGDREEAAASYRRALGLDKAHRLAWGQLQKLGVLTDEERATVERLFPGQKLPTE